MLIRCYDGWSIGDDYAAAAAVDGYDDYDDVLFVVRWDSMCFSIAAHVRRTIVASLHLGASLWLSHSNSFD